jgi:hypothetical protein
MIELREPVVEDGSILIAKTQILAATMYPEFIPDIAKIHWLIRAATQEKDGNYSRVVGPKGDPKGAIITRTANNLWAMKKHASVVLWYSELPGGGAALLRGFRDWVKTQPQIVLAGFYADWLSFDERPLLLAERIGFARRGDGGRFYFPRGSKAHKVGV